MTKKLQIKLQTVIALLFVLILSGCSGEKLPPSEVTGKDSLPGKVIGTQIGTTGDIYAADYCDLTLRTQKNEKNGKMQKISKKGLKMAINRHFINEYK